MKVVKTLLILCAMAVAGCASVHNKQSARAESNAIRFNDGLAYVVFQNTNEEAYVYESILHDIRYAIGEPSTNKFKDYESQYFLPNYVTFKYFGAMPVDYDRRIVEVAEGLTDQYRAVLNYRKQYSNELSALKISVENINQALSRTNNSTELQKCFYYCEMPTGTQYPKDSPDYNEYKQILVDDIYGNIGVMNLGSNSYVHIICRRITRSNTNKPAILIYIDGQWKILVVHFSNVTKKVSGRKKRNPAAYAPATCIQ